MSECEWDAMSKWDVIQRLKARIRDDINEALLAEDPEVLKGVLRCILTGDLAAAMDQDGHSIWTDEVAAIHAAAAIIGAGR